MVFQIFRGRPSRELADKVLNAFDLSGVHDSTPFTRADIARRDTPSRLEALDELPAAYLPCKSKYADPPLNVSKSLTILRHMLKAVDAKLVSAEMCIAGAKLVVYRVRVEGRGCGVVHVVRCPVVMFGEPGHLPQPEPVAAGDTGSSNEFGTDYDSDWE